MQKNLLIKTVIIVAVLLVFLGGIFGIPSSWNGQGLKEAVQNRIHLGLDLKGGTHLILQVMVNEAISAQTDSAIETLKTELGKAHINFAAITKPDPDNHPERIVVQGVSNDDTTKLREIAQDRFQDYDLVGGTGGAWSLTMKPTQVQDLKVRTVDKSIEAIRRRVDSLGVSEPVIQRNGMGNDQILVELPGVDDPGRVKEIIQSTARLELRESRGDFASEQEALQQNGGIIPANMVLLHGKSDRTDDRNSERVYLVSRVPVASGTDIKDASAGTKQDTNRPIVNFFL